MNKSKSVIPIITGVYFVLTGILSLLVVYIPYNTYVSGIMYEHFGFVAETAPSFSYVFHNFWSFLNLVLCIAILIFGILCITEKKGCIKAIILIGVAVLKLIFVFQGILFNIEFYILDMLEYYEYYELILMFINSVLFEFLISIMPVVAYIILASMVFTMSNGKGNRFKKFWYAPAIPIILSIVLRVISTFISIISGFRYFSVMILISEIVQIIFVVIFAIVLALYGYYVSSSKGNSIESK